MSENRNLDLINRKKKQADELIIEYYHACIPLQLRKHFKTIALKYHKELYLECEKLKQIKPIDAKQYEIQMNNYMLEGKKLIRLVAFDLHRLDYHKKNPRH